MARIALAMRAMSAMGVLCLVALPFAAPPYLLHVAIVVLINVVYTAAVYSILRMGYLSFGHAGFIALGAYSTAILTTKFGVSPWIGIAAGGVAAALFGWALGALTLKLRGIYFSLSIFAFGEIVNAVFRAFDYFGGPAGVAGVPRPTIFGLTLESHLSFYFLVLAFSVISIGLLLRLQHTRFGFTLLALKTSDTERLAESIGIDAARYKTLAFVVSCAVVGVMGAVHAHYLNFVSPSIFTLLYSTDLVIYAMVGGIGSFLGPVVGAALLTALGEQLFSVGYYKTLVYAVILLVVILALPGGLLDLPRRLRDLLRRKPVHEAGPT